MKWLLKCGPAALCCLTQVGWGGDALDNWTASNLAGDVRAMAFGHNSFVAVRVDGTIATSPDGANWIPRESGVSSALLGAVYGGGRFVVVGGVGPGGRAAVLASLDGVTWTQYDAPTTNSLRAVAYGGGLYVAVGGDSIGRIITSPDGTNWTLRVSTGPGNGFFHGVTYGNGRFLAIAPGGMTATSADGLAWTTNPHPLWLNTSVPRNIISDFSSANGITYGNGVFVVVGEYSSYGSPPSFQLFVGHGFVLTSSDGFAWTLREDVIFGIGGFGAVSCGAGVFVAQGGGQVASSLDGFTWTLRNVARPYGPINYGDHISYGDHVFLVYAYGALRSGVIGKLDAKSSSGQFLGTISGVDGQNYSVESSANLVDWTALTQVTVANGAGQFRDEVAPGPGRHFYRAKLTAP